MWKVRGEKDAVAQVAHLVFQAANWICVIASWKLLVYTWPEEGVCVALERYVTLQFTSEGLGRYLAESSYHLAASRPLFPVLSLPTLSWSLWDDVSGWKPMTDSDHGFSHSPDTLWNDLRQWLPNGFKKYTHLPTSSTYYQLSKRKLHSIICSSKWTKFMLNFKSIYIWLLRDMRDIVEASKQDDSVI